MKRVIVLSTGGTISMEVKGNKGAKPTLNSKKLLEGTSGAGKIADICPVTWKNIPSNKMMFNDIKELATLIKQYYEEQQFDGIVITHGTDTLEESAYFLDLIIDLPVAIVFTGAQRNQSQLSSDGPANLFDSVLVAANDEAKNKGVLVVFNSEIHAARDVTKTHSMKLETFQSPEVGALAVINNKRVMWLRNVIIKEKYKINQLKNKVYLYKVTMNDDSNVLNLLPQVKPDGLVLETMGGGHVPPDIMEGIKNNIGNKIPVVATSRCWGRLFTDTYDFSGSEKHLRDNNVIWGDGLSGLKARVKLIVLLSAGFDNEKIKTIFEHNYYF